MAMVDSIDEQPRADRPAAFPVANVEALRQCDILVACVDRLQVRDDLNRLAKRYLIPLFDIGLEITPDSGRTGGIAAIPGQSRRFCPTAHAFAVKASSTT